MSNGLSLQTKKLIIYILLAVITFAVFSRLTQFDFVNIDDDIYVTGNVHLQDGISRDGLRWAFTTTYAEFWHPLTWLSLMLDYQFFGVHAGGYHLTNLLLHVVSSLLLFWLFNRMTTSVWRSAFVAAIFALHPLRVESVAWVAERKDVLSAFFWMMTLCFYVYYTEKTTIQRYLLVVLSFVGGLLSKPMVVTLPVIMMLLDVWPLRRFASRKDNVISWQLKEKLPFLVLSAVVSIVTLYAQYNPSFRHFSLSYRLANAPVAVIQYLWKILWPFDLAILYDLSTHIPRWHVISSVLIIFLISVAVIVTIKRSPYFFVGWLWYIIALLPVIGITQIGTHSPHDLYTYMPSIGIAMMLVWGLPSFFQRVEKQKIILYPLGTVLLIVMALLTWRQCGYWQNSITLLNHNLNVTNGHIALVHNNIGVALAEQGQINEAIDHYNEAIRLKPNYADAYNNKGSLYGDLRQYRTAIENFNKAIALKSDDAKAYYNRGTAYFYLGRYQQAIDDFNESIRITNDYADALHNRAVVYFKSGNMKMACEEARKNCEKGFCKTMEQFKSQGYCQW